jgi:mRNA interferase MazF
VTGSAPAWGDVWDLDLGSVAGHEQAGRRPALVVSSDWFNRTRAELVLVVPLSTRIRPIGTHVRIDPPEGGIESARVAMCEHVRSVSTVRLARRRGRVSDETMSEVVKRLKVLLLLGART